VATGVWQVPTLFLWENLRGAPDVDALMALPELRYVSPAQREQWRRTATNRQLPPVEVAEAHNRLRLEILRAIHEVGGRILMGSDAPQLFNVPGFALHREMERMEAAGMSRDAVLASGTRAVAEYVAEALGGTADFGVVAVGNRADLLLLEGNPLENLQHLQRRAGVMVAGRWISGEEIEARLARIAERYGAGTGG
jgi:imidazolonepropionase-like amidohydrolase